ncbi:GNAT family N-acetyltransferase [Nocardia sp. CDC159]|uniref:GNAT family N-acetyltransferase n=1 Tax=Nocardia pulmonis TaxID=2951408 RepID=A0A9X2E1U3_9NOCA|nr:MULTISPECIES: GNAT family N-acetyltransferase [Nocardia]MCM6772649.1 GNAT family N-acetyltransferase [Nocardia pulmonis]MCM6786048.1 GNAT family N-acetyltransferase [Nocardia sp. CDC159]
MRDNAVWSITPEPPDSAAAAALWRAYYTEVSDRWYLLHAGRRTDPAELEREIAAEAGADLVPPTGVLLVASHRGVPGGMAGLRLLDPSTAELKRLFVIEALRGSGRAARLVRAAEDVARKWGARRMVLDTRSDLVEARALYARLGYAEIEPYNDGPYAQHWFGKHLSIDAE